MWYLGLIVKSTMYAAASQPSRHLLLGNISSPPNESALETVFGKFGPLDSVKVFPGKTYALVSFKELAPAAEAMQCLDGHSLLSVSGQLHCFCLFGVCMQIVCISSFSQQSTHSVHEHIKCMPLG